jgi:hypothetical protein
MSKLGVMAPLLLKRRLGVGCLEMWTVEMWTVEMWTVETWTAETWTVDGRLWLR